MRNRKEEDGESKCLECGNPIPYGSRSDRVFCSEHCKNAYHYHHDMHRVRIRNLRLKVFNAIDKNYSILNGLIDDKITTISLSELAMKGYMPSYITAISKQRPNDLYWCFDISFRMSAGRLYKISRK